MSSESENEAPEVSEQELSTEIKNLLEENQYKDLTLRSVRNQLEEKFNIDLIEKKPFIKAEITKYLKEYKERTESEVKHESDSEPEVKPEPKPKTKTAKKAKHVSEDEETEGNAHSNETEERKRNISIMKLDDKLSDLCGAPEMTRNEVLKKVWAYIREAHLQDPEDKKLYHLDDKLKDIFGVDDIRMVEVNKLLSSHLTTTDKKVEVTIFTKKKASKEAKAEGKVTKERKHKAPQLDENGNKIVKETGLNKPLKLSPEMAEFVGEKVMSRPQVVKKLWAYIKENNLQDPENRKNIKCDDTLTKIMGVDEVTGFSMNKYISKHFIKEDK